MNFIEVQLELGANFRRIESKMNELKELYDSISISDPDIETRIRKCKITLASVNNHYKHFNAFIKLSDIEDNEDLILNAYSSIIYSMSCILNELEIMKQKILKHNESEKS